MTNVFNTNKYIHHSGNDHLLLTYLMDINVYISITIYLQKIIDFFALFD